MENGIRLSQTAFFASNFFLIINISIGVISRFADLHLCIYLLTFIEYKSLYSLSNSRSVSISDRAIPFSITYVITGDVLLILKYFFTKV